MKTLPYETPTASAHLVGRRLVSAGVCVGEGPVEGGDVEAAASAAHQSHPRLEDGRMSGAGVKLQAFGNALHQHDPEGGEERDRWMQV